MPIDYSKWDKLELSDDSDIEVHPNVDKKSFIKWKQRDIHEKRQQRNIEIKSILVQLTMYAKLNERVDYLLENLAGKELCDGELAQKVINDKFDEKEKFDYERLKRDKKDTLRKGLTDLVFDAEEMENTPAYNEMIDDLLIQVKEDNPEAANNPDKLRQLLEEHRKKIDDILSKQTIKLDELLNEKANLISSEDYHTGWDKSFLNKDKEDKAKVVPGKGSETVTEIETINALSKSEVQPSNSQANKDELDDLQVHPSTADFAKIPQKNLNESAIYLLKHTYICTEKQKDALIMTAFDHQLRGDSAGAKQIIHQSLLLQYISQLTGSSTNNEVVIKAIKLFFSKINESSSPAKTGFYQDVENTFNHIKQRCEIIKEEQGISKDGDNDEEEALIQLKALDEDTTLLVNLPMEGTKEYEIFRTKLSPEMQDAVKTGSLDEVNKVFAKLKVEDAEKILDIFNQCGVIGINGYLENEEEFKELQKQYNENAKHEQATLVDGESNTETVDIVD